MDWILLAIASLVILIAIYQIYAYFRTDPETHILIDWGKVLQKEDVINKIQRHPDLQFLKFIELPSISDTQVWDMYKDTVTRTPGKYHYYKKGGERVRKGLDSFNLYYVRDINPKYEYIKGISYKKRNVNTTHLKKYIRDFYKLGFGIHVTDSLSESDTHRHILQIE